MSVCVGAKAASPSLTSPCLPACLPASAFQGLNPDKACLDLLLPVHNQGAEEGRPQEVRGRLGEATVLSEKVAVKVTPTMT